MSQQPKINRRWLNRMFKEASQKGTYFTGRSPRDVAHTIVRKFDMHPAYVGTLDELIVDLIDNGVYSIASGRLVRSDNVISIVNDQRQASANRKASRQRRVETAARRKRQATAWHSEHLAAY